MNQHLKKKKTHKLKNNPHLLEISYSASVSMTWPGAEILIDITGNIRPTHSAGKKENSTVCLIHPFQASGNI